MTNSQKRKIKKSISDFKKELKKHMPKNYTRKLSRTGRVSYTINVPKSFINKLGWKERQNFSVKMRGEKIIIEKK